jgi:phage shock protein A
MQRDADGEPKESKASLRLEKNVQRAQKVVESAFGKASSSSIAILQRWKSGRRPMNAEVQLVAWRHVQKAMEYINLHHLTGPRCE